MMKRQATQRWPWEHSETSFNQMVWYELVEIRWPRLVRAMEWAAILTPSEAAAGIRDYVSGREMLKRATEQADDPTVDWLESALEYVQLAERAKDMLRYGGGEAVAHYGGPRTLIKVASSARVRHVVRLLPRDSEETHG